LQTCRSDRRPENARPDGRSARQHGPCSCGEECSVERSSTILLHHPEDNRGSGSRAMFADSSPCLPTAGVALAVIHGDDGDLFRINAVVNAVWESLKHDSPHAGVHLGCSAGDAADPTESTLHGDYEIFSQALASAMSSSASGVMMSGRLMVDPASGLSHLPSWSLPWDWLHRRQCDSEDPVAVLR
jgi:hypothetical protein